MSVLTKTLARMKFITFCKTKDAKIKVIICTFKTLTQRETRLTKSSKHFDSEGGENEE